MIGDDNLVGQRIGNYGLTRVIARGAYGSVYAGQHWLFKDELAVAIKLLHARMDGKAKLEQFQQEAYLLRNISIPTSPLSTNGGAVVQLDGLQEKRVSSHQEQG